MIHRSVKEWASISYGSQDHEIPEDIAVQLHKVPLTSNLGRSTRDALTLGRTKITARQTVGIIATPDASLEILPKIDNKADAGIREQLIHMLKVAYDLPLSISGESLLGLQQKSLLDVLIHQFATKLYAAVKRALPHRYRLHRDDLPMLRGNMLHSRQFSTLAAKPDRLACEFDEFSADTPLNQIMKATIKSLLEVSNKSANLRLLRELHIRYSEVADVHTSVLPWAEVKLDRTNRLWHPLFVFARLLLTNKFQNTTAGKTKGIALLFEMNDLFEAYISRLVKRELAGTDYSVAAQGGLKYCLQDTETMNGAFQTKPDILIRKQGQVVAIIDTKWKLYEPGEKEASQADVYQMMAYAQVYQCPNVVLLYPHGEKSSAEQGVQRQFTLAESNSQLTTATVELLENKTTVLDQLPFLSFQAHT